MGSQPPAAHKLLFHVGGNLQYRRTGEISFAHRSHGVGSAGASAGQEHPRLASSPGVAVGHVAAAQLQAASDESKGILVVKEGIEQVQGMHRDDTEYGIHPL